MVVSLQALRTKTNFISFYSLSSSGHRLQHRFLAPLQRRSIFSTAPLENSWMDKIKGIFTGNKTDTETQPSLQNFSLIQYADAMKAARMAGTLKQYLGGKASEATVGAAFERQEKIVRYLGDFDPTGENLQSSHKQEAAKHCKCTIADIEQALSQFAWAKEAEKKVAKLREEGKPLPTSIAEMQKVVSMSPLNAARSNLAKSGPIGRNSPCPCGSKKKYKWCCGKG